MYCNFQNSIRLNKIKQTKQESSRDTIIYLAALFFDYSKVTIEKFLPSINTIDFGAVVINHLTLEKSNSGVVTIMKTYCNSLEGIRRKDTIYLVFP